MTTNTAKVQARIAPGLKARAERVLEALGISPTDAIRMFYRQVDLQQGMPFALKIPNETTLEAIREAEHPEKLESYSTVDELFDSLDED